VNSPSTAHEWAPPVKTVLALFSGAAAMSVCAALFSINAVSADGSRDGAGQFLTIVAALLLLAVAAHAALVRPRLAILASGAVPSLALRTLRARHEYRADQLAAVSVVRYPRFGRRVPMLEIEPQDESRIFILSRWDLGANPLEVADALASAGFAVREPG
jgi:hypothetical protein